MNPIIKPVKRSTKEHGFGTEREPRDLETSRINTYLKWIQEAYIDSNNLGLFQGILIQGDAGTLGDSSRGTKVEKFYSFVFEEEICNPQAYTNQFYQTKLYHTYEQDREDRESSEQYLDEVLQSLADNLERKLQGAIIQRDSKHVAVLNPNPETGLPLAERIKRSSK